MIWKNIFESLKIYMIHNSPEIKKNYKDSVEKEKGEE